MELSGPGIGAKGSRSAMESVSTIWPPSPFPPTAYRWLTPRFLPVPAVRIRESRPGAAGDPQLRPRGVGRHQVSGRLGPLRGRRARRALGGRPLVLSLQRPASLSAAAAHPLRCLGQPFSLRSHAPQPGRGWAAASRPKEAPWGVTAALRPGRSVGTLSQRLPGSQALRVDVGRHPSREKGGGSSSQRS